MDEKKKPDTNMMTIEEDKLDIFAEDIITAWKEEMPEHNFSNEDTLHHQQIVMEFVYEYSAHYDGSFHLNPPLVEEMFAHLMQSFSERLLGMMQQNGLVDMSGINTSGDLTYELTEKGKDTIKDE